MRNHSYENDFDLHENKTACRTHFHMKGFALRLVLKQRHKKTRKWPINYAHKLTRDTKRGYAIPDARNESLWPPVEHPTHQDVEFFTLTSIFFFFTTVVFS